jgi:hypothetical protein
MNTAASQSQGGVSVSQHSTTKTSASQGSNLKVEGAAGFATFTSFE